MWYPNTGEKPLFRARAQSAATEHHELQVYRVDLQIRLPETESLSSSWWSHRTSVSYSTSLCFRILSCSAHVCNHNYFTGLLWRLHELGHIQKPATCKELKKFGYCYYYYYHYWAFNAHSLQVKCHLTQGAQREPRLRCIQYESWGCPSLKFLYASTDESLGERRAWPKEPGAEKELEETVILGSDGGYYLRLCQLSSSSGVEKIKSLLY